VFVDGIFDRENIEDLFAVLASIGMNLEDATILDVGANIGNHSVQFSKRFGRVVAFEPIPRIFEILESNTKRLGNVTARNVGLGREAANLSMDVNWANMGSTGAVYEGRCDEAVDVSIVSLDETSSEFGRVDVIKVDVEGMELDVLLGSVAVLRRDCPVVCIEQHPVQFTTDSSETPSLDFLRSLGYRMFALESSGESRGRVGRSIDLLLVALRSKRRRSIVEFPRLPRGNYPVIYAIHSSQLSGAGERN